MFAFGHHLLSIDSKSEHEGTPGQLYFHARCSSTACGGTSYDQLRCNKDVGIIGNVACIDIFHQHTDNALTDFRNRLAERGQGRIGILDQRRIVEASHSDVFTDDAAPVLDRLAGTERHHIVESNNGRGLAIDGQIQQRPLEGVRSQSLRIVVAFTPKD